MATRKPYPSDVSDEEWAFVAPYLALVREDVPQRDHDLREVLGAADGLVCTPGDYLSGRLGTTTDPKTALFTRVRGRRTFQQEQPRLLPEVLHFTPTPGQGTGAADYGRASPVSGRGGDESLREMAAWHIGGLFA